MKLLFNFLKTTTIDAFVCIKFALGRTFELSVGEFYAGDIQLHQQIDRPPRVRFCQGMHARPVPVVRVTVAVVSFVGGTNSATCIGESAALVRRTIECHVYDLTTIYRHCTTPTTTTSPSLYHSYQKTYLGKAGDMAAQWPQTMVTTYGNIA